MYGKEGLEDLENSGNFILPNMLAACFRRSGSIPEIVETKIVLIVLRTNLPVSVAVLNVVGLLHGDMSQVERNEVITAFKHKSTPILAATDVAGMIHHKHTFVTL